VHTPTLAPLPGCHGAQRASPFVPFVVVRTPSRTAAPPCGVHGTPTSCPGGEGLLSLLVQPGRIPHLLVQLVYPDSGAVRAYRKFCLLTVRILKIPSLPLSPCTAIPKQIDLCALALGLGGISGQGRSKGQDCGVLSQELIILWKLEFPRECATSSSPHPHFFFLHTLKSLAS
jgi:hypothetical protein